MSYVEYSSADLALAENAVTGMERESDDCLDQESLGSEIGAGNTITPQPFVDDFTAYERYYQIYPVPIYVNSSLYQYIHLYDK